MGVGVWQLARLEEDIELQQTSPTSVTETPEPSR
jgi:hypothetical protein